MVPMKTRPATPPQSAANCWIPSEMPAGGGGARVTSGISARRGDRFSRRPGPGRAGRAARTRRRGLGRAEALAVTVLRVAPPRAGEGPEGVLDLLDVDVQALGELGRELVARLRRHRLEGSVEPSGRHAERGREPLADVAAAVAPVPAGTAIRLRALQCRAHLR